MITKEKLLDNIEKITSLEKSLVPLLNKHVASAVFFSKLNKNDQKEIIENFQRVVLEKTKYIEILNSIKSEITRREQDVY
jgi:hypothetical protein